MALREIVCGVMPRFHKMHFKCMFFCSAIPTAFQVHDRMSYGCFHYDSRQLVAAKPGVSSRPYRSLFVAEADLVQDVATLVAILTRVSQGGADPD